MSNNQNDISLKDLILGVKKYIYVIKKGWLFLLLSLLLSNFVLRVLVVGSLHSINENHDKNVSFSKIHIRFTNITR